MTEQDDIIEELLQALLTEQDDIIEELLQALLQLRDEELLQALLQLRDEANRLRIVNSNYMAARDAIIYPEKVKDANKET